MKKVYTTLSYQLTVLFSVPSQAVLLFVVAGQYIIAACLFILYAGLHIFTGKYKRFLELTKIVKVIVCLSPIFFVIALYISIYAFTLRNAAFFVVIHGVIMITANLITKFTQEDTATD